MTAPLQTVAELLSAYAPGRMFVVPPSNLEPQTVPALLQQPGVVGVILRLPDENLAAQFPGRVGWFNGSNPVTMPEGRAETMLSILDWPFPSPQIAASLKAAGVKRLVHCPLGANRFVEQPLIPTFVNRLPFGPKITMRLDGLVYPGPAPAGAENTSEEAFWRWSFAPLASLITNPLLDPTSFTSDEIAICTGSLGSGGSERQTAYTVAGLRARRANVSVALSYNNNPHKAYVQIIEKAGVVPSLLPPFDLLAMPASLMPLLNALSVGNCMADHNLLELMRYATLFARTRPSVVHAWLDWSNITAGLAALAVGVPRVILSGRSLNPRVFLLHQAWMRPGYALAISSPRTKLLNNSAAGAADYAEWLSAPPQSITVIRNALDSGEITAPPPSESVSFRESLSIPEGAPVVCGVMRLSEEKRPDLFLRIAAEIRKRLPDCHFVLAGDGPMRKDLTDLVDQLELQGRTHLIGATNNPAIPLSISNCLLLTSRVEGLPNVLIEAQALGVPAFTCAVGGAPEAVDEGVSGWAIQGDDPAVYADAIVALLNDPARAQIARERGPAFVKERFSMDRMIDETLAAYGR